MRYAIGSLLVVVFLFLGCKPDTEEKVYDAAGWLGQPCKENGTCNSYYICEEGTCIEPNDTATQDDDGPLSADDATVLPDHGQPDEPVVEDDVSGADVIVDDLIEDVDAVQPDDTFVIEGQYDREIDYAADMVLYDAQTMILSHTALGKLTFLSLRTLETLKELTISAPSDLVYEQSTNNIYTIIQGTTDLARINATTGDTTLLPIGIAMNRLALGPEGFLFIGGDNGEHGMLLAYDLVSTTLAGTIQTTYTTGDFFIAYDAHNDRVLTLQLGGSPAPFHRYAYDKFGKSFSKETELAECSNGRSIALTGDGQHAAFSCGGGNREGYTIVDYDPTDFTASTGEWLTDAYPGAGAFSPDDIYFFATNMDKLIQFTVVEHAQVDAWSMVRDPGLPLEARTVVVDEEKNRVYMLLHYANSTSKSVFTIHTYF